MNISILLPTRGRLDKVRRLYESVVETTNNLDLVELILRIDDDDNCGISEFAINNNITYIVGKRHRGYIDYPLFINQCGILSSGKILMCLNDDAHFETIGWDKILVAEAEKYTDDIFVFGVNSIYCTGEYVFPIISRKMFLATGEVCCRDIPFTDTYLRQVGRLLGRNKIIEQITIRHENMRDNPDITSKEGALATFDIIPQETRMPLICVAAERIANILRSYMKESCNEKV